MAQQQNDSKLTDSDSKSASESATGDSGRNAPEKDLGSDMTAPYGTRSRNRTGNPRPNYAEDKDYDVEMYDVDQDKSNPEAKKTARQSAAAANGETTRGNGGSRKSLPDDARTSTSSQAGISSKDHQPGSSTGATPQPTGSSTTLQVPRKRKAATTAAQANSNAASSTRKGASGSASVGQNSGVSWSESNMLTFGNCNARPQNGRLVADDGTVLEANDHVYLVCEPPGEPYYLGRIMEFLHAQNDASNPIDALRINWYYRPRDIGRKVQDTRVVFATMHSDISPLTAIRGKCQIRHRVEIDNMDEYRKVPDCFWYEKLYDRYIQKNYDLIPTASIVNVPEKVKKVLDERWKYVLVEQGRGKELTSAVKSCKRCAGYCASNDSVDCAVCQNTYHMNCVKPPLLKKPSRGFAWSCAACSRAQERKLEARHTPNVTDPHGDLDEDELLDEEEDDAHGADTGRTSPATGDEDHHHGTPEQIYHASLWPYRYLGMHCKPEDALDYDDRIYPRASTRIGPRHQAPVNPWPGKPVQYVKPPETKKGGKRGGAGAASKESQAAQDAEKWPGGKRPKWVQDMPPGYIARGEDCVDPNDPNATATCLWKPPVDMDDDALKVTIQESKDKVHAMARRLGVPNLSTNLQDIGVELLYRNDYDLDKVLKELPTVDRKEFKEPNLSAVELKRFEEGVAKYGSELHLVMKHVKTLTPGEIVRFYYTWKKTEKGRQIWGNFTGRKGKKEAKRAEAAASKLADDVADDDDDSAFDSTKAAEKKRAFMCHFCSTTTSRRWRRAPNATAGFVSENGAKPPGKDKADQYVVALCARCAELWRRYAIRWEDIDEMSKKVAQAGGKAWKRKQDEEVLKELQAAKDLGMLSPERASTPLNGTVVSNAEPPRKKLKSAPEKEVDSDGASASGAGQSKKKERISEAPITPEMPKPRTLPCAICDQLEPLGDQHVSCRECRLSVHRNCYGILDNRSNGKWVCDMCINDKNPQVSLHYKCVLCPVTFTEHDFVEQPKLTHHKKKMSDKDREREKFEVQQARKAAEFYRKKQEESNRPVNPREPLKRTADNNWVHVTCAVWTSEVKFGNAKAMEPSEGIPSIPRARYDEICQACGQGGGACVSCQQCHVPYHVECARKAGHILGFEVTPVKSSRRDQFNIVNFKGESGTMSASVWCKDHVPAKTVVHRMEDEADETGLNTLQFFAQNFKQADLTLTGTVRKANLMTMAAKTSGAGSPSTARRASTTTPANASPPPRNGSLNDAASDAFQPGNKVCITCGIDVSPRWWPIDNSKERSLTNGHYGSIGSEAQKFVEQRKFQCHACYKKQATPRSHSPRPSLHGREEPRRSSHHEQIPPTASHHHLRSPQAALVDHRDSGRPIHTGWAQPHHQPQPVLAAAQPVHASHPSQPHLPHPRHSSLPHASPPPPAPSSTIPAAAAQPPPMQHPHRTAYAEWGHRPGSQHGSPPRHLNGGPPPPPPSLVNGPSPPPMSNLSSLRPPPAMTGAPPPGPLHGHPHGPPYMNGGLPPSPRRTSGSVLAQPFTSPSYGHGGPPPPPPPPPGHARSNGAPPPRADPYQHRPPYYTSPHDSHYGSRQSLPPPTLEQPAGPSIPPRNAPEHRPASGASASPSLRNLLS